MVENSPIANEPNVKERLLEAADRLFYREGVRAIGIDRILAEAGAAKASLYAHFGSKDDLIAAYIARRTEAARADIDAFVSAFPPEQRALRFFDHLVEWTRDPNFRGCPLQHLVGEITDCAHPARASASAQRDWMIGRFREWAQAAGATDPARAAGALFVLLDGAAAAAEQDGPERAVDARWAAERVLA